MFIFENFLSPDEASTIIMLSEQKMQRSTGGISAIVPE
jgi:hypothetical protein